MLLANASGNRMNIDMPMTADSVRTIIAIIVHTQDRQNENASSRTIDRNTPTTPPAGRNPMAIPSTNTITDASE